MESENDRGGHTRAGFLPACILIVGAVLFAATVSADGPPAGVDPEAWGGIQQQIEIERLRITGSDRPGRLYRADNPTQRFTAHFGAEDVLITPRSRGEPDWQLGLRLTAWGAADNLQPVHPGAAYAEDNRIEFRRGPLTEWYVNTAMGLKQGFTIEAPPADGIHELVLEMTLEGDLTAELAENGNAVTFRREGGNAALLYSGLASWDAVDEPLDTRIELVKGGTCLRITVAVPNATWPITVDPVFSLVQKIPSPVDPMSWRGVIGHSIAIDGEWMVVGRLGYSEYAPIAVQIFRRDQQNPELWEHVIEITPDDSQGGEEVAAGISGDTVIVAVNRFGSSSRAYLFQRDHGGPDAWGQVAAIEPGDGPFDSSGTSVVVEGDFAVMGVPRADNSDGAAYVFERDQGGPDNWGQAKKIPNPDPSGYDYFGISVALEDGTLVVGSDDGLAHVFYRDGGGPDNWGHIAALITAESVAVSGDIAVVGRLGADSAYVYQRHHGGSDAWGLVTEISPDDAEVASAFGTAVSVDGSTIAVGAYRHDGNGLDAGAVYVFERDFGGTDAWGQVARVGASEPMEREQLGYSTVIEGDSLVVGAPGHYDGLYGAGLGAVHVFARDNGGANAWGEIMQLPRPPYLNADFNHFGVSVDIEDETAVIGATGGPGWAHIYQRAPGKSGPWHRLTRITADNDDIPWRDEFGFASAISGDTLVVGAPGDNKYDPPNPYWDTGSAYIFQRDQGGPDNWGLVTRIYRHTFRFFGYSVAIDGDTVIVGGEGDPYYPFPPAHIFQRDHTGPNAWGHVAELYPSDGETSYYPFRRVAISGDISVLSWFNNGAVYMFERDHGGMNNWGETAKFETECHVGGVAIDDDTLVIGALDGSDSGPIRGAAFVFQRDHGGPNAWGQVATIIPHDSADHDGFGHSVSIDGDTIIVGKYSSGQNGAVYSFHRDHGGPDNWGETGKFSDFDSYSLFGTSVSVSEGMAIVGAYQDGDAGIEAGAAYIFTIGTPLFFDGFESGDTSLWSGTVP